MPNVMFLIICCLLFEEVVGFHFECRQIKGLKNKIALKYKSKFYFSTKLNVLSHSPLLQILFENNIFSILVSIFLFLTNFPLRWSRSLPAAQQTILSAPCFTDFPNINISRSNAGQLYHGMLAVLPKQRLSRLELYKDQGLCNQVVIVCGLWLWMMFTY